MKKYFVVETDEVCEFGDVLNLTFFKDLEDGRVTVEKEVKFTEDTMDWMIEMGFVQEREVEEEEENDLIDFGDDYCPHNDLLNEICEDQEKFEKKLEILEEQIKVLKTLYDGAFKEKKTAQPKKK